MRVFERALCPVHNLCSDEILLKKETNFLFTNFDDEGFNKKKLKQSNFMQTQTKLKVIKKEN